MRWLFFLMLFMFRATAQEVYFEGHIQDYKTSEPIPYVNLSFLNTLKGTSTDEDGHFFLNIPESYLNKQIHISSLGYKDTIVAAELVYKKKHIGLVEESFELDEVVVSEMLGNSEVLNAINSRSLTSGFTSSATPWVLALYFPNIGSQNRYVEKITVFFQKNSGFQGASSKFRLRLYYPDEQTGMPGRDMVRKSMVLEAKASEDFVSIDLTALHLKIPRQGIYIGLEWLFIPYNWYKKTEKDPLTNKVTVEDRFAPTFGGLYNKDMNYRAVIYGMGTWTDFTVKSRNKEQNFVPAISLKVVKEE